MSPEHFSFQRFFEGDCQRFLFESVLLSFAISLSRLRHAFILARAIFPHRILAHRIREYCRAHSRSYSFSETREKPVKTQTYSEVSKGVLKKELALPLVSSCSQFSNQPILGTRFSPHRPTSGTTCSGFRNGETTNVPAYENRHLHFRNRGAGDTLTDPMPIDDFHYRRTPPSRQTALIDLEIISDIPLAPRQGIRPPSRLSSSKTPAIKTIRGDAGFSSWGPLWALSSPSEICERQRRRQSLWPILLIPIVMLLAFREKSKPSLSLLFPAHARILRITSQPSSFSSYDFYYPTPSLLSFSSPRKTDQHRFSTSENGSRCLAHPFPSSSSPRLSCYCPLRLTPTISTAGRYRHRRRHHRRRSRTHL